MPVTPDFDVYDDEVVLVAETGPRWVRVTWADGGSARFHHVWLRDNCPCSACVHPVTHEQTYELPAGALPRPEGHAAADGGALVVTWSGDGHRSRFHGGWLRRHVYDPPPPPAPPAATWDASTDGLPPTFDGTAVLDDDAALHEWLVALRDVGLTRLTGVPTELDAVGRVASRIGPIRETNFGVLWDVRSEPAPITNANTPLPLPVHADLITREHQPGLQFLHCIRNAANGGRGRYVDGFRVAEVLHDEEPDHYGVLTTVAVACANRSTTSDYRWSSPPIVLDGDGQVVELRVGNWLRAPLAADFDVVEDVYAAMLALHAVAARDELAVLVDLRPGDLMAFDNRRVLHGRTAFDGGGDRLLRGCYGEREELRSRLRVLEREARRRLSAGV